MIDENNLKLKLVYILGLRDVVLSEIKDKTNFVIFNEIYNSTCQSKRR